MHEWMNEVKNQILNFQKSGNKKKKIAKGLEEASDEETTLSHCFPYSTQSPFLVLKHIGQSL